MTLGYWLFATDLHLQYGANNQDCSKDESGLCSILKGLQTTPMLAFSFEFNIWLLAYMAVSLYKRNRCVYVLY